MYFFKDVTYKIEIMYIKLYWRLGNLYIEFDRFKVGFKKIYCQERAKQFS